MTEGAQKAVNDRIDTSVLRRLAVPPAVVPVPRDDRNDLHNAPLTLEGVRDRLLVLHQHLHHHCLALGVLRGALAGDDTIREVADVLDQYVLSEDIIVYLETVIAELAVSVRANEQRAVRHAPPAAAQAPPPRAP